MNAAQTATLQYWQKRFPRQYAQAVRLAGVDTGFGQTSTGSTFDSILGGLSGLLTSYGQYKIASQVVSSQQAASQNVLALPGSAGSTTTNWLLYGGIALVAVVAVVLIAKKRKK